MLRKFHEASMASFLVVKIFVNLKIHELTKIYPIYYYKILTRVPTTFTFLVKIGSTELNIDFSKKMCCILIKTILLSVNDHKTFFPKSNIKPARAVLNRTRTYSTPCRYRVLNN